MVWTVLAGALGGTGRSQLEAQGSGSDHCDLVGARVRGPSLTLPLGWHPVPEG